MSGLAFVLQFVPKSVVLSNFSEIIIRKIQRHVEIMRRGWLPYVGHRYESDVLEYLQDGLWHFHEWFVDRMFHMYYHLYQACCLGTCTLCLLFTFTLLLTESVAVLELLIISHTFPQQMEAQLSRKLKMLKLTCGFFSPPPRSWGSFLKLDMKLN